ncbi:hypothetical protein BJY00DRAFT_280783 [Aspergillus carlsbadensis]|nr:hypothetical protein BJY00DRAFT_280783 [Aspergillus carlsbadensis]
MEEPLAARVKKIVITERNYGGLGAGFKWERIEGIRYLETNQDSIKMWQVLFQQFDNLRTVRVQRPVTAWDLDELELLTASDAFTVVMHIIITAQLPITAFELDFEAQGWNAIDLCRVRSTQLTGKSFENSWNRLRALSMRLKVADRPVSNLPYYLMRSCPNLKSLSLDCDGGEDAGTVLKYMAENWMNPLWKLEEIALRKITVLDVPHFRGFLLRHRSTLRKLKLASINLDEPFIWPKVFAMLRTNFPKLESIEVGDLRDFGDARRLVHFPNVSTTSTADTGGVRFVYHQRKWPAVDPRATKKNFYIAYQGDDIKTALWLLEQWVVYLPLGP